MTEYGTDLPSKADATAVAHAVTQNLARQDLVGVKNGDQLLLTVSLGQKYDGYNERLTASVTDLGRLEM